MQRPRRVGLHLGGAGGEELGDERDRAQRLDLLLVVFVHGQRLQRPCRLRLDMPVLVGEEHHERLDAARRRHRLLVRRVHAQVLQSAGCGELRLADVRVQHRHQRLDGAGLRDGVLVLLVRREVPQRPCGGRLDHGVARVEEADERRDGPVLRHHHLAAGVEGHGLQLHRRVRLLVRIPRLDLAHELVELLVGEVHRGGGRRRRRRRFRLLRRFARRLLAIRTPSRHRHLRSLLGHGVLAAQEALGGRRGRRRVVRLADNARLLGVGCAVDLPDRVHRGGRLGRDDHPEERFGLGRRRVLGRLLPHLAHVRHVGGRGVDALGRRLGHRRGGGALLHGDVRGRRGALLHGVRPLLGGRA
mmetsp:Transcript_47755/g.113657  ORF Transcript_47755/g.113657 Transcript_47755/m.113657 type:complete len:358 (-) Transcript_47755:924-1997(-)